MKQNYWIVSTQGPKWTPFMSDFTEIFETNLLDLICSIKVFFGTIRFIFCCTWYESVLHFSWLPLSDMYKQMREVLIGTVAKNGRCHMWWWMDGTTEGTHEAFFPHPPSLWICCRPLSLSPSSRNHPGKRKRYTKFMRSILVSMFMFHDFCLILYIMLLFGVSTSAFICPRFLICSCGNMFFYVITPTVLCCFSYIH
jgi:hypothetical protein